MTVYGLSCDSPRMTPTTHRKDRKAEALDGLKVYEDVDAENGADPSRFLLIEVSRFDSTVFVTSWDSVEDALAYHDGNEYPEDWPIHRIVDLDEGVEYDATDLVTTTSLVRELPTVTTGGGRVVSARSAAYVADVVDGHEVRIQHPQGGYILAASISDPGSNGHRVAEHLAADLNGVIAAWAHFTAEA